MQEIEMLIYFIISIAGGLGASIRVLFDNSKNDNRTDDFDDLFKFSSAIEKSYAISLWKRLIVSFGVGIIVGWFSISGFADPYEILRGIASAGSLGFASAYAYRILWDELEKKFPELYKLVNTI